MKILCDVHISIRISKFFESKGIQSIHVNNILDKWFISDAKISDFVDQVMNIPY